MLEIEEKINELANRNCDIRSIIRYLEMEAQRPAEKFAVERLKSAPDRDAAMRCIGTLKHAFLNGTPGSDGWPRKF